MPERSVVVASHERPLRLRWLLDAPAEQELPRDDTGLGATSGGRSGR